MNSALEPLQPFVEAARTGLMGSASPVCLEIGQWLENPDLLQAESQRKRLLAYGRKMDLKRILYASYDPALLRPTSDAPLGEDGYLGLALVLAVNAGKGAEFGNTRSDALQAINTAFHCLGKVQSASHRDSSSRIESILITLLSEWVQP
jgi:hypothetical protein